MTAVPELCIEEDYYLTHTWPALLHAYIHPIPFLVHSTAIMSNEAAVHDDLVPEQTEGFKVGEKKTIDEYQKLGKSRNETHALVTSTCNVAT